MWVCVCTCVWPCVWVCFSHCVHRCTQSKASNHSRSMVSGGVNHVFKVAWSPPDTHTQKCLKTHKNKCQAYSFIFSPLLTSNLQLATSVEIGTRGENLRLCCEHTHTKFQGVAPGGYVILGREFQTGCSCAVAAFWDMFSASFHPPATKKKVLQT